MRFSLESVRVSTITVVVVLGRGGLGSTYNLVIGEVYPRVLLIFFCLCLIAAFVSGKEFFRRLVYILCESEESVREYEGKRDQKPSERIPPRSSSLLSQEGRHRRKRK